MGAATYNFEIEQGSTFNRTLTFKQSSGVAMDLTGYGIRGQMRRYPNSTVIIASFTLNISAPPTNGIVSWSLTSVQTTAIKTGNYVYDIELYLIGTTPEFVDRCMEGKVIVIGEVTRWVIIQ